MSLELVEWAASWPLVLPYFDGRVPAGFPSPAEDYLETPLDLTEFLIENKTATFLTRVDGDSMKDAGTLDGDLLVVDRAAKPVNGSVVVVAVNGEHTVKRLRRGPDCVWLDPANPRYQPICVSVGRGAGCVRRGQARHPYPAMNAYPTTPDGRYFVVRGRLWRCSNPALSVEERQRWTHALMQARRAKGNAMRLRDREARETALLH